MTIVKAPIKITTPFRRYASVGHCIYCGAYSNQLDKEHIIPFGLADDSLVLPKASCRACGDITGKLETVCLRQMWWPFRTRIGAPTRGKCPPEKFEIKLIKGARIDEQGILDYERDGKVEVDPAQFPFMFYSYRLSPPGLIEGRAVGANTDCEPFLLANLTEFRDHTSGLSGSGMRVGPDVLRSFARMLAKIAHSYAIAELGSNRFKPLLQHVIRNNSNADVLHLVGGDWDLPAKTDSLHELRLAIMPVGGTNYLLVGLRLFCFLGTPQYWIVAGRFDDSGDQSFFLADSLYRIDIEPFFPPAELVSVIGTAYQTRG